MESGKYMHNCLGRKSSSLVKSLLKYVVGSTPELGKVWKDCRYLYAPCCAIGCHWFAVKIDLEDPNNIYLRQLKESCPQSRVRSVYEASPRSDCGIFTVKYIEFLQANMDVSAIRPECIPMWRKKLAAELLAWHFEP
ncbi:sentrin-specific protease 1-like [Forsythia ovata]|uniref:Sentrin-specific protease 1-like n=1 Tax=Forsythia ovata TaxID=205694 RepID=A0ABD1VPW5_9LAMI